MAPRNSKAPGFRPAPPQFEAELAAGALAGFRPAGAFIEARSARPRAGGQPDHVRLAVPNPIDRAREQLCAQAAPLIFRQNEQCEDRTRLTVGDRESDDASFGFRDPAPTFVGERPSDAVGRDAQSRQRLGRTVVLPREMRGIS
jgi:hypothetical protein